MKIKKEKIKIKVTVEISYMALNKESRKRAIAHAINCVTSTSIYNTEYAKTMKAKLLK